MAKKSLSKEIRSKKIRVLAYCDSPTCATGFGTVSRNIFEALHKTGRYEIDILGINFWGDPHSFPYRIWPTGINNDRDPYGRKKVMSMIPNMEFDILFLLQDSFILDFMPTIIPRLQGAGKKFKSICYYPIDGRPKVDWIKNINFADYPVAYTQYGADQSKDVYPECKDLEIIPHGVNINDFKVLPEEDVMNFKKMYFGKHADKFIVTNVNRNQHRKDIPRTIAAFKEFRKKVPNSLLYLHMAPQDQGWNLLEVIKAFGLTGEDVIFPANFGPNQGYPREIVNMLYNASDLVISSALGEGWGLAWVEAMATKTPVLMPNNTAITENITEDKGYLCGSGTNPSLFTVLPHDNEVVRPLVDVEDMAAKMVHIYENYGEALVKADKAYSWVREELNWQGNVGKKWVSLFDKAYADLLETRINKDNPEAKVIETENF